MYLPTLTFLMLSFLSVLPSFCLSSFPSQHKEFLLLIFCHAGLLVLNSFIIHLSENGFFWPAFFKDKDIELVENSGLTLVFFQNFRNVISLLSSLHLFSDEKLDDISMFVPFYVICLMFFWLLLTFYLWLLAV